MPGVLWRSSLMEGAAPQPTSRRRAISLRLDGTHLADRITAVATMARLKRLVTDLSSEAALSADRVYLVSLPILERRQQRRNFAGQFAAVGYIHRAKRPRCPVKLVRKLARW